MTAIGINVSDKDETHGWEAVQPNKQSKAMVAYLEARETAQDAWRRYTEFVDSWIAVGNYEAMEREAEKCEALDRRADVLYHQAHCNHPVIEWIGHAYTYQGEAGDSYRPICQECGKEIDISD